MAVSAKELAARRNGKTTAKPPSSAKPGSSGASGGIDIQALLAEAAKNQPADASDFSVYSNVGGKAKPQLASAEARRLYKMTPTEIVALQNRLLRAGFYGSGATQKDVNWGAADPMTADAFKAALQSAGSFYDAGSKFTVDDMLDSFAESRDKNGMNDSVTGNGKAPLTIQLDNPDDLKMGLSKVTQSVIGRKVTAEELGNAFVQSYQAEQAAAQTAAYNQDNGGTTTAAPSFETAAEKFTREKMPVQAGAHDVANTGQQFFDLLKGIV